ncbi:MAG: hypothetical protein KJN79_00640 [Gammaproteobacteria bacterium]|nr:hypothetical protein [Gammaproteobacteria bacterium]
MSLYAELTFQILSSLSSSKNQIGFRRTEDVTTTTVRTDITEEMSGTLEVADAVVDQAVQLGGVATGKVLYLESDRELTFKFNGGTDVLKLTPTTGAKAKLMWEGEFTALAVSNASGETATLTYYVAG